MPRIITNWDGETPKTKTKIGWNRAIQICTGTLTRSLG